MANKIKATTQVFTDIENITNDIAFFKGGYSCVILEVSSVNFYLLSQEEQEVRIYGFMSLLNSLAFPIQILIVSKNIDVSTYLGIIDQKIGSEKRSQILEHLRHYKEFIESLIKSRNLLDKKFYIVVPFSNLELGPTGATAKGGSDYVKKVEGALSSKKTSIMTEVQRMGLSAKQLKNEDIVKLFYEVFNQDQLTLDFQEKDIKNIIV